MANHFGARVPISRFQRLKTHRCSHPGVALGYYISRPWRWEFKS